jgi:peptide deformylase
MSIRPIVRLGHPALRIVAEPVAAGALADPATQELVDDMIDTMRSAHGVGLAAPQIAVLSQIFVYEVAPLARMRQGDEEGGDGDHEGEEDEDDDAYDEEDEEDAEGFEEGDEDFAEDLDEDEEGDEAEEVDASDREGEPPLPAIPLHVVVNPMLTPLAGDPVYDWEGCLSIPDLRGLVPRHPAVRVRGLDRHGQAIDYVASGFEARIVQHEFDHLNGVVFLDRMGDFKALAYREEWERYMAPDAGDVYPDEAASPSSAAAAVPGAANDADRI